MLANTEELHERIERLCARIRELEDALKKFQAAVSDHPHPLLRSDLLQMKAPVTGHANSLPGAPVPAKSEEENVVDAFGTLAV